MKTLRARVREDVGSPLQGILGIKVALIDTSLDQGGGNKHNNTQRGGKYEWKNDHLFILSETHTKCLLCA